MPLIKRYANRKLYNPQTRAYITLDEIAEMIRRSEEVRIFDHKTNSDITNQILTQIIFEQEKNKGGLFPQFMLMRLIQVGGSRLYNLQEALRAFQNPFEFFEDEVSKRLDILSNENQISSEEKNRLMTLLLDQRFWKTEPEPAEKEAGSEEASLQDISNLLDEIEQLEEEVKKVRSSRKEK